MTMHVTHFHVNLCLSGRGNPSSNNKTQSFNPSAASALPATSVMHENLLFWQT